MDRSSLSHTKWNCMYHIVFIPKYRRRTMYGKLREDVREIIWTSHQNKKNRDQYGVMHRSQLNPFLYPGFHRFSGNYLINICLISFLLAKSQFPYTFPPNPKQHIHHSHANDPQMAQIQWPEYRTSKNTSYRRIHVYQKHEFF